MTMTMSDNHTELPVPLDLTTKSRENGSCADPTPSSKGRPRDTTKVGVECNSRGSTLVSPTVKTDSDKYTDNRVQSSMHSNLKHTRNTDNNLKPSEISTLKLPLRKRPFPVEESGSHAKKRRTIDSNTDSIITPSPAEVTECVRNNSNVETENKKFRPTPVPAGSHCVNDVQQTVQPHHYTYIVSHPSTSIPASLHLSSDADCLLNEIDLATRRDEDGDTALHIAVAQEKEPVVHRLIHILIHWACKNLDLFNNLRQTPLHLAVITHQPRIVAALLHGGADPGALDRHGQTTMHLCCEHNEGECLSVILSYLSRSPCYHSGLLDSRNYEGLTPLHLAVHDRNKKLAKMLLDSGADINAVDIKSGRSPLVHAVEINCLDMVNFLIENGCNVNCQSYSGNTALHLACGRGEVEAVRVLLKNGADSSLKNYHNDTAVMVAKNHTVSAVLRGKATRGHFLKNEQSFNDSPSPKNVSGSPLAASNPQCSASRSPVAHRTHSPHSQSGESISGNQSPVDTREKEDLQMRPQPFHDTVPDSGDCRMSFRSFHILPSSPYGTYLSSVPHINVEAFVPAQPRYSSSVVQRHMYLPDVPLCTFPSILGRAALPERASPPSVATQSRPSSHTSDRSETSNTSVSSEGKGIS